MFAPVNALNHRTLLAPYPVPYHAQIASPELATAIFVEGRDPALDPRWRESGARDPQEYAYWSDRACGVACVKMCVEALGGSIRPLIDWARRGDDLGGYLREQRPDGSLKERGWLHQTLAELIEGEGFKAQVQALELEGFAAVIASGGILIASVSHEIGTSAPVTRRGGHLVVVFGVELDGSQVGALILHNPSGRTRDLQAAARIAAPRFAAGYSGRVITVHPM